MKPPARALNLYILEAPLYVCSWIISDDLLPTTDSFEKIQSTLPLSISTLSITIQARFRIVMASASAPEMDILSSLHCKQWLLGLIICSSSGTA